MAEKQSLYQLIRTAAGEWGLPLDFSLPQEAAEGSLRWVDGARDGVAVYHMAPGQPDKEALALMRRAVLAAAEGDDARADSLFARLGSACRAVSGIPALHQLLEKTDLPEEQFRQLCFFALRLMRNATDTESVKYALALLRWFEYEDEGIKQTVRTLGLSDEFTLHVLPVMRDWPEGNDEIFRLARKVFGWGRIHAVEALEPETEEIRAWLLTEGVNNRIMPAYSALTCWRKAGVEDVLAGEPTPEEFAGIREILDALMEEQSPTAGLSGLDDPGAVFRRFLQVAETMRPAAEILDTVRRIRAWGEEEDEDLADLCRAFLDSAASREAAANALKEGKSLELLQGLGQELGLDWQAPALAAMDADFPRHFPLAQALMQDPAWQDAALDAYRRHLPLEEMKAPPGTGMNPDSRDWKAYALEQAMWALRPWPLDGTDLVETALQTAFVRLRYAALQTLSIWVQNRRTPLADLLPSFHRLLERLRPGEPDKRLRERMDRLLAGETDFS